MRTPLLTALALGLVPASDLVHAPAEGSRRSFAVVETTEWNLTEIEQVLNGQTMPIDDVDGMTTETVRFIELVDAYTKVEGEGAEGAVRVLERSVARADSTSELGILTPLGPLELTVDAVSPLADAELRFEWDADDERFAVERTDEEEGDLSDLEIRSGLAALVGEGEHAEGDSWTVDVDTFLASLCIGGDLGIAPSSAPFLPGDGMQSIDVVAATQVFLTQGWDETSGEVSLEWAETVGDDGERSARIDVELELELESDVSEALAEIARGASIDMVDRDDYSAVIEWALNGSGTLEWDLERRVASSLELQLDGVGDLTLSWTSSYGDVGIDASIETSTTIEAIGVDDE